MTSTKWKLATALGVAGAIALSVPSAEARSGRNAAIGFGIAAGALALGAAAATASQPRYYYDNGPYAYQPYAYDSYGYHDAPAVHYAPSYYAPTYYAPAYGYNGYNGYYRSRSAPVRGTNYNPNAN